MLIIVTIRMLVIMPILVISIIILIVNNIIITILNNDNIHNVDRTARSMHYSSQSLQQDSALQLSRSAAC